MGGGAFAQAFAEGEPTLSISRTSAKDYESLKSIYLQKLQDLFPDGKVASLIEAPQKTDYGDIDIFIAVDRNVDLLQTAKQLGVAGVIYSRGMCCNLAVRIDGRPSDRPPVLYKYSPKPSPDISAEQYAQIDVEIIPSRFFEWHSFMSAYGDMSSMVGHIVSPLGFRFNDHGLWLRLDDEIDLAKSRGYKGSNKDGLVLLSSDVKEVMQFLDLSIDVYERKFETLRQLYEWLGQCRLISAEVVKSSRHKADRKEKRVVFTNFFDEWLPARMDMKDDQDEVQQKEVIQVLRAKYLHEALDFFSKHEEYTSQQDILVRSANETTAQDLLKGMIVEHSGRSESNIKKTLRSFRRWLAIDPEGNIRVCKIPHSDAESQLHQLASRNSHSLCDPQSVSAWVRDNWEQVRALES